MGSKLARPAAPAVTFVPDQHAAEEPADEPPGGGLRRADAWAIALAWRDELRGCVRLETDAERCGLQLIDSFEWITFVFDRSLQDGFKEVVDPKDTAAAARAATIAWYALSCCTGYSVAEYPRFWRRVFTELYYPEYPKPGIVCLKPQPERPQYPITEATPLFPRKDKPFPRIRLVPKTAQAAICLQTLLTRSGTDTHSAKLEQILTRLQPFLRSSQWCRRPTDIPVAIENVSARDLATILQEGWLPRNLAPKCLPNDLPRLRLSTVFLSAADLELPVRIHEILDRTDANVVISTPLVRPLGRSVDWLFVGDATRVGRIQFDADHISNGLDHRIAPVLSALPHNQSATAVRFDVQPGSVGTTRASASDWAWLGSRSRFAGRRARRLDVFLSMAVDNNLLTESGRSPVPRNTAYEMARVRATTTAHVEPRNGASVLWSFPSEATLTVCTARPEQPLIAEWVPAVIPGAGFGWIRGHDILDITSHPPGASCLRRLRLTIHTSPARVESMLRLLTVVGSCLQHLDIESTRLMDADQVRSVLALCPALTSLRISHNGSYWSESAVGVGTSRYPRLHQLVLTLRTEGTNGRLELQPLKSPLLDELRMLRVVTSPLEPFATNREAFLATLARYPCLQYAHHTNGNKPNQLWVFKSYDERRAEMLALLGPIQEGVHDIAHGPVRLDCCLAFLSVIRHLGTSETSPWRGLERIGSDLVRTILSFTTSPRPRDVFIDECTAPRSYYY